MKNAFVIRSLFYSLGQITQGLLLHPYQTMQSLVREKFFVWMSLLPTVVLVGVTLVWKVVLVPVVHVVFSCDGGSTGWLGWLVRDVLGRPEWLSLGAVGGCSALPFISNWITFFCVYWQAMLIYLLFRFGWGFKRE